MKKITNLSIFIILFLIISIFILNVEVKTLQGINYKVHILKIPLYLKILDFYDRHFNYKWLVHKITKGITPEEEKVMAIFKWTIENIIAQPPELRTIDDHVWNIIIRGYGANDQFSDVFATLCNYAGQEAFFTEIVNIDRTSKIPLAFIKIRKRWCVFDAYNAIYFINKDGSMASVEDIREGNWVITSIRDNDHTTKIKYADYFRELLYINFEEYHKFSRANIQSPIKRLLYGVVKHSF